MSDIMKGFPPGGEAQVTLANWREHPYSTWGFSHVREIIPTAEIANNPDDVWSLPSEPADLSGLKINDEHTLTSYLDASWTDGFVVMHKGAILHEDYRGFASADKPHILMSVSKSILGVLAGILEDRGLLDAGKPVSDYVPEIASTAWRGASVQNLLDMRAGVEFSEDYEATSGAIIEYRKSTGWNPLAPGEAASDLRSFFNHIDKPDGEHGGRFHYVSPNTDLLAWIIERATGERYANLMSQYLWQPMGAERSGYITVDRLGAPRAAGGMCVALRDLARVGLLVANDGKREGQQIIPKSWINTVFNDGDKQAWAEGDFVDYFPGRTMHYRNKWYVENADSKMAFCVGIHGQNMYVIPDAELVIAKTSSRPAPLDPVTGALNLQMVKAVKEFLS